MAAALGGHRRRAPRRRFASHSQQRGGSRLLRFDCARCNRRLNSHPMRRSPASSDEPAATLSQVAALAQVSAITVSRALRNQGSITEKTRRRVLNAADAVGYVPNRLAGGLASAASGLIGVIVPSLTN